MKNNINHVKIALMVFVSLLCVVLFWRYKMVPVKSGQENILLVGTNSEFPPMSFVKDGELTGFDIDLITAVANRLNMRALIKDLSFDALLPELQMGTIQVGAAGFTPTPERAARVLFTKPYLNDSLVIIIKKESRTKNMNDLAGKIVAVNEGYSAERYLKGFPNIIVEKIQSASVAEGLLALKSNRADAFIVAEKTIASFFTKEMSSGYTVLKVPNSSETYAIAVSKKYPELLPRIQRVLDELEKDGALANLRAQWGLS